MATEADLEQARYAGNGGLRPAYQEAKMFPTPTAACSTGGQTSRSGKRKDELLLAGFARMYPTPTCQDAHNNGSPLQVTRNAAPLNAEVGGSLNPAWVAWLMGWPHDAATGWDWTSLDPAPAGVMESMANCWQAEPLIPRVTTDCPNRVARLAALGNGQVPAVVKLAWEMLK